MLKLSRYSWQSRKMKRSFYKGNRRSARQGTSLEFSDFRTYQPGDDLRQIDWNIYARTNKHFIKRFLDEQDLALCIFLDCSRSVSLLEEKWEKAKGLSAALGYMSLAKDDRVSVIPVGLAGQPPFSFKKGRAFSNHLIRYVDKLIPSETSPSFSAELAKNSHLKANVAIVISDFLEPAEALTDSLKKLQAGKKEVYLIQLLSGEELSPAYMGDLQLKDSENGRLVKVTMSNRVKKDYMERLELHNKQLEKFCYERGIGYALCSAQQSIEQIIFTTLLSKGWIG